MPWPCLGLCLLLLCAGAAGAPEEKKPVPVYTNDDLARVSPLRDETGVASSVAVPPPAPAASRGPAEGRVVRGEAYWRREADRLHDRLRLARDRMDTLRARIAERETRGGAARPRSRASSASTETQVEGWRRQLEALEARVHDEEARFLDRARREGALPGWIR
jgi:hypothetical protein